MTSPPVPYPVCYIRPSCSESEAFIVKFPLSCQDDIALISFYRCILPGAIFPSICRTYRSFPSSTTLDRVFPHFSPIFKRLPHSPFSVQNQLLLLWVEIFHAFRYKVHFYSLMMIFWCKILSYYFGANFFTNFQVLLSFPHMPLNINKIPPQIKI